MAKHGFLKLLTLAAAAGAGYYAYTEYKKQNDELEAELAGEFDDSELDENIERNYSDIEVNTEDTASAEAETEEAASTEADAE